MKSLPVTLAVGGSGEVGGSTRLLMNVHHGNHIGLGRQERASVAFKHVAAQSRQTHDKTCFRGLQAEQLVSAMATHGGKGRGWTRARCRARLALREIQGMYRV